MPQLNEEFNERSIYEQLLLNNRERILALFVQKVRIKIPSAKAVDDKLLENKLFEFLTTLARIVSKDVDLEDSELFNANIEASRDHGISRAKIASYTLDQVIIEFRILRNLIFSVLEEDGLLPSDERDKILFAIDNGITQAATEFALNRGFKDARLRKEISAKNLALDQAEDLREEKLQREKFFSAVTHDMRNPLFLARVSAELIMKNPSDPMANRKYAQKIIKSIDRSNLMIKDLLDSNKLRSGEKISLQKSQCQLDGLILETCDDLSEVYGPRFKIRALPKISGMFDFNGVKRILENLMTNAIKYGADKKDITVSLSQIGNEVCIQVHNEGNPIPVEDQSSLFEHYKRAKAQEGQQQGWGIGLTLVKGITEAHGGRVEVTSSEKDGTTFSVYLPL